MSDNRLFHRVSRQSYLWWTEKQQWLKDHPDHHEPPNPLRPPIVLVCQRGCLGNNFSKQLAYELRYNLIEVELLRYVSRHLGSLCEWVEPLNATTKQSLKQWKNDIKQNYFAKSDSESEFNYFEALKSALLHGCVVVREPAALLILNDQPGLKIKIEASTEDRMRNLCMWEKYSDEKALQEIQEHDIKDKNFIVAHHQINLEDQNLYDKIINISEVNLENAIWKIIKLMREKNYPVLPRKEKFLR